MDAASGKLYHLHTLLSPLEFPLLTYKTHIPMSLSRRPPFLHPIPCAIRPRPSHLAATEDAAPVYPLFPFVFVYTPFLRFWPDAYTA